MLLRSLIVLVALAALAAGAFLFFSPVKAESVCLGAAALDPDNNCVKFSKSFRPSSKQALAVAKGVDRNRNLCRYSLRRLSGIDGVCVLGSAKPKKTIALIGDSHAAQWRPALDAVARRQGLSVYSLTASVCDYNILSRLRAAGDKRKACTKFRKAIPGFLRARPAISIVIFAHLDRRESGGIASYKQAWAKLPPSVTRIIALRDNPRTRPDLHDCLAAARRQGQAPGRRCALKRSLALLPSSSVLAARQLGQGAIDLSDYFCDQGSCYPVVGSLLVYGDGNHQTRQFNHTLAPYLEQELLPLL